MKITHLQSLLHFLLTLSPEQLGQQAVLVGDESPDIPIRSAFITKADMYVNKNDNEDYGTLEVLRGVHGESFNQDDFKIMVPAGKIFFSRTEL